MREPLVSVDGTFPHHLVRDETSRRADSRHDWRTPVPSASELAASDARAPLTRAVGDFLALCRAKHVSPTP